MDFRNTCRVVCFVDNNNIILHLRRNKATCARSFSKLRPKLYGNQTNRCVSRHQPALLFAELVCLQAVFVAKWQAVKLLIRLLNCRNGAFRLLFFSTPTHEIPALPLFGLWALPANLVRAKETLYGSALERRGDLLRFNGSLLRWRPRQQPSGR